jgi:hypothetical protein
VFEQTAKMERAIGHSCIKGVYLDELDPKSGHDQEPILPDCGNFCDIEYTPKDIEFMAQLELGV